MVRLDDATLLLKGGWLPRKDDLTRAIFHYDEVQWLSNGNYMYMKVKALIKIKLYNSTQRYVQVCKDMYR